MKFMEAVETAYTAFFSLVFLALFLMIAPLSMLFPDCSCGATGSRNRLKIG